MPDSKAALRLIKSVASEKEGSTDEAPPMPPEAGADVPGLNDAGNGVRFARVYGDDVRYVGDWGYRAWQVWEIPTAEGIKQKAVEPTSVAVVGRVPSHNVALALPSAECLLPSTIGGFWRADNSGGVMRRAKTIPDRIREEKIVGIAPDEIYKWANRSLGDDKLNCMLRQASSETGIAAVPDEFDQHPMLFNCLNGTLDLLTGEFRSARRSDMLTKCAPVAYDPKADFEDWLHALDVWQPGEDGAQVVDFLGRMACYCLSANTDHRGMFLFAGTGAGSNGKTTFIETLRNLCGPYAVGVPMESLMAKFRGGINEDVARLAGARMATASESEEAGKFSIAKLKGLMGGDTVTARFLNGHFFDFVPTHKLIIGTNYLPNLRNAGKAFLDKLYVIPFKVSIPKGERKINPDMKTLFKSQLSGILNWVLLHREKWLNDGLGESPSMQKQRARIEHDEDLVGNFLEECYDRGVADGVEVKKEIYKHFQQWCEDNSERPCSMNTFGQRMEDRGFDPDERINSNTTRVWRGLKKKSGVTVRVDDPKRGGDWQKRAAESGLFTTEDTE